MPDARMRQTSPIRLILLALRLLQHLEQTVPVAVRIELFDAVDLESRLSITLGVELYELHSRIGYRSKERDVMVLLHRVADRDVVFVFHDLNIDAVVLITSLGF